MNHYRRIILPLLALAAAASLSSYCMFHKTVYVENEAYERIVKLDDIVIEYYGNGFYIIPRIADFDKEYDASARAFYTALDTPLTYTGKKVVKKTARPAPYWCALDWRLVSIDVIATEDFDETHPAGSSLNEFCFMVYDYNRHTVGRPLTDVSYGTLMLTEYYWEAGSDGVAINLIEDYPIMVDFYKSSVESQPMRTAKSWSSVYLDGEKADMPTSEIRITDAFGRTFISYYDGRYKDI